MDTTLQSIIEIALQQGIWAALYIYLFFRMLKENAERETQYQQMINHLSTNVVEGIADINDKLDDMARRLRQEKLENRIVHLREKFGIRLTAGEEQWLRSLKSPGKPHLGRLLVQRGLADELSAAIKTYLSGVPGRDRIDSKTAIDAILAAGGIPVWAHPLGGEGEKRLTRAEFEHRLAVLMAEGIRGLECCYSRYGMDESDLLLGCAREKGLLATGGSDYHGSNKKGIELGQLGTVSANWSIDTAVFSGIILQKEI